VWRLRGGDPARIPHWSRLGLWGATAFATVLALANPSVVSLWHDLGSVVTPVLLLPVLLAFAPGLAPGRIGVRFVMLVPAVVTLSWTLWRSLPASRGGYPFHIEPIVAGLASSLLTWGATRLVPRRS
jgi:hypothetical protein